MASFVPSYKGENDFNKGEKYRNEIDSPSATDFNNVIENLLELNKDSEFLHDNVNPRLQKAEVDIKSFDEKLYKISETIEQDFSETKKKVENLYARTFPEVDVIDSSVAYQRIVPSGALPYAEVAKVGGMSYSENLWTFGDISSSNTPLDCSFPGGTYTMTATVSGSGQNQVVFYTVSAGNIVLNFTGGTRSSITFTTTSAITGILIPPTTAGTFSDIMLNAGSTAALVHAKVTEIESVGKNLFDDSILGGPEFGFTKVSDHEYFCDKLWLVGDKKIFVNTGGFSGSFAISGKLKYADVGSTSSGLMALVYYTDGTSQSYPASNRVYGEYFDYNVVTDASKTVDYICFTFGSSVVLTHVKDFQIEKGSATGYKPYKANTLPIPADVQALPDYGKTDTYIEWRDDGRFFVTPDGETNISDILPEDNFIRVEGGGMITAVNEYDLAVPITINYQVD